MENRTNHPGRPAFFRAAVRNRSSVRSPLAAGKPITRERGRSTRKDPEWQGTDGPGGEGMASMLGVAAGYGLAISALVLYTVERMFGARGTVGRLTVLAATVGALMAGTAVVRARRSLQRRRLRDG